MGSGNRERVRLFKTSGLRRMPRIHPGYAQTLSAAGASNISGVAASICRGLCVTSRKHTSSVPRRPCCISPAVPNDNDASRSRLRRSIARSADATIRTDCAYPLGPTCEPPVKTHAGIPYTRRQVSHTSFPICRTTRCQHPTLFFATAFGKSHTPRDRSIPYLFLSVLRKRAWRRAAQQPPMPCAVS